MGKSGSNPWSINLIMVSGPERKIREDKIKNSVAATEKDPFTQKMALSLEHTPIISKDLNKEKGVVFEYEEQDRRFPFKGEVRGTKKLMFSAIRSFL